MGIIAESPVWEPTIYSLETTDPVEGGVTGISNRSRIELANRTTQIRAVLAKHGIEVNPADNIGFTGQWVDPAPTFEGSVIDSDVVYYNIGNAQYEKAQADGSTKQHFVGVADVTNDKVIGGGFIGNPVISGAPAQGDIIYLSDTTPGQMTTSPTPVAVGKWIFTATMMLNAGVGGSGGGAGSYQHEQDSYRMLLDSSYYKNGFFDALQDESFISHDMTFDFGSNRLDFTVGEQMTTGNLKDPLVSLTIDEAFLSVDITDGGATVFEMSADGGSNWEVVSNNAVHLFANTGSDLRVRITGGGTGQIESYGVMYNVEQQIKGTLSIKHSELDQDEPLLHFLEGDIDHSNINDDEAAKHRLINDGGTGANELWSASKINSEIGAAGVGPSSVGQAELKTSVQTQSQNISGTGDWLFTLTGGQYIFYPQYRCQVASVVAIVNFLSQQTMPTSYVSTLRIRNQDLANKIFDVRQRYVTASGEVNWLFILRNIESGEFDGVNFAVDHPCFGNGGNPEDVPHPFIGNELDGYEIFLVNPSDENVAAWESDPRGLNTVIREDYEIDELADPGMPDIPVTVGLPTDAENLPWGSPIEPIKIVIPTLQDVIVTSLKLKS
jgi:hypothetical protein